MEIKLSNTMKMNLYRTSTLWWSNILKKERLLLVMIWGRLLKPSINPVISNTIYYESIKYFLSTILKRKDIPKQSNISLTNLLWKLKNLDQLLIPQWNQYLPSIKEAHLLNSRILSGWNLKKEHPVIMKLSLIRKESKLNHQKSRELLLSGLKNWRKEYRVWRMDQFCIIPSEEKI